MGLFLLVAQSRQKSYYDRHHRQESYNLDEKAYLRVTDPNDSVSKESWPHVTLDLSAILLNVAKFPTNLNYLRTFPEYMMYSMCHNSGVASRTPSAKSTMKRLIYKMTFLIENTPFVFLIPPSVSLADRILSFSKFSGHTTLRKKPRGKEKTVLVPSTPPSSRRLLNLGTRFFRVGASCQNPLLGMC